MPKLQHSDSGRGSFGKPCALAWCNRLILRGATHNARAFGKELFIEVESVE